MFSAARMTPASLLRFAVALGTAWLCVVPAKAQIKSLFIFGDEYVDTGSKYKYNKVRCQTAPYGMNTQLANGRCSDGDLLVDWLAKELGLRTPGIFYGDEEDKKSGVNFAFKAAGALSYTNMQVTYGLDGQWSLFQYFLLKNPNISLADSLFVISFGMNDYKQGVLNGTDPVAITDEMIPKITKLITDVQNTTGAYRFLIITPPPMGCLPIMRQNFSAWPGECLSNLNALNQNHDFRMDIALERLALSRPVGLPIYWTRFSMSKLSLDPTSGYAAFNNTVEHACGKVDNTTGEVLQCGQALEYTDPESGIQVDTYVGAPKQLKPEDYFWFDWVNPTQGAYKNMWNLLWSGSDNTTTFPMNVKTLVSMKNA